MQVFFAWKRCKLLILLFPATRDRWWRLAVQVIFNSISMGYSFFALAWSNVRSEIPLIKDEWCETESIDGALEGGVWWPQTSTIFLVTSHFSDEISLTSPFLYWTLTYFVCVLCVSLAPYFQHLQSGVLSSLISYLRAIIWLTPLRPKKAVIYAITPEKSTNYDVLKLSPISN